MEKTEQTKYTIYARLSTKTELGGLIGLIGNRIEIWFFKHREPDLLLILWTP